jgi:hypothetical protein
MQMSDYYYDDGEGAEGTHPNRRPQAHELNEAALRLMQELPAEIRPEKTAARFPHIVNRFAQLWGSPKLAERYFDDLLMDARGGRQGFPLSILSELQSLKEHYFTAVHPKPASKWDDVFTFKGGQ